MVKGFIRSAEALFAVSLLLASLLYLVSFKEYPKEEGLLKERAWRIMEYLDSRGILKDACNSTSQIEGWLEKYLSVEFDTAICKGGDCSLHAVPPRGNVYTISYPMPDCGFGDYEIRLYMWLGDER